MGTRIESRVGATHHRHPTSSGLVAIAHRTRPAFTLIELLVVIAIIALLIAILLPSLEAARRQSKLSTCLSHIKNIATSSRVYEADDEAGWGIPVHPKQYNQCTAQTEGTGTCGNPLFIGAYEWGGKSGVGFDIYSASCTPPMGDGDILGSKYGSRFRVGPATRPMNRILYPGGMTNAWGHGGFDEIQARLDTTLALDIFKCPADTGPPRGASHCACWILNSERSSYDHFGNSYAANIFMVMSRDQPLAVGFEPNEMGSNSPYMRPTSRVPTPARTIYYEENIGRWAWACRREVCDGSVWDLDLSPGIDPGPTKTIRGWHGRDWTFNRAFVDAHAETQKVYIEGTEDSEGYALHYRNECDPTRVSDDTYDCQPCIRVRGPGWQKDTQPAGYVRTHLIGSTQGRPSYESLDGQQVCIETPQ